MKVEELNDEIATSDSHLAHLQQADNPEYDVVVETEDCSTPGVMDYVPVKSIRWDHDENRMILETD